MSKNIVIIGAGPAGLSAAHELLSRDSDLHVTILEADQTVGGLARTVCHNGNHMDIGGHRFFSKNSAITAWWDARLPMSRVRRRSSIIFRKQFIPYPLRPGPTLRAIGFLPATAAILSCCSSRLFPRAERSLEDFCINRFGRKLYSMFFEPYTEKVWGRHPSRISADWGAQRIKGLSLFKALLNNSSETSLIREFRYPDFGPGQLWERVAMEIMNMGGRLLYGKRVTRIEHTAAVTAVYCGEERFPADVVISSMPLRHLIQAMNVPERIRDVAEGLPSRAFITVGLLVRRLLRPIQDCWLYIQEPDVRMGRLQLFSNWSPRMACDTWLGTEYFCDENDFFWRKPDEDIAALAAGELEKMGLAYADEILDWHCERAENAYPCYFGTYDRLGEIQEYLSGIHGLICVGRSGQHRYNNMDHSMMTGFLAAGHILGLGPSASEIWKVNETAQAFPSARYEIKYSTPLRDAL